MYVLLAKETENENILTKPWSKINLIKLHLFAFSAFLLSKRLLGGKRRCMGRKLMLFMTKDGKSVVQRILNMGGGSDLESGFGR